MTNKTLFWSFFANFCAFCAAFCAFCASLRLKRTVFTRLQLKVRPKGLHSFAFYILIFAFSLTRYASRFTIYELCSLLEQSLSLLSSIVCRLSSVVFVAINQRNPRLIKDLRVYKCLYNCRETFTDVMSALQIKLFMQNKPNFRKSQMNVTSLITADYEKKDTWWSGKNKPNSNPIQTQFKPNLSRRSLWRRRKRTQFPINELLLTYTVYGSEREAAGMGGNRRQ